MCSTRARRRSSSRRARASTTSCCRRSRDRSGGGRRRRRGRGRRKGASRLRWTCQGGAPWGGGGLGGQKIRRSEGVGVGRVTLGGTTPVVQATRPQNPLPIS